MVENQGHLVLVPCVFFGPKNPRAVRYQNLFSSRWKQNTILTPNLQRGAIFSIFELRMAVSRVHQGASGPGARPSGSWPSPAGGWPQSRPPLPETQNAGSELIGAPQTRCAPSLNSEFKSASVVAEFLKKRKTDFQKYVGRSKCTF